MDLSPLQPCPESQQKTRYSGMYGKIHTRSLHVRRADSPSQKLSVMEDTDGLLRGILILSCLGCGMMAGLFISFSTFMMKAFDSLERAEATQSMPMEKMHE